MKLPFINKSIFEPHKKVQLKNVNSLIYSIDNIQ